MEPNTEIDDTQDSSPATDANEGDSSALSPDDNAPKSMLDAVTSALDKAKGDDEDASSRPVQGLNALAEDKEETEAKDETAAEEKPPGKVEDAKKAEPAKAGVLEAPDLAALGEKFKNNPGVQNLIRQHHEMKANAEKVAPLIGLAEGIKAFVAKNRISQETFDQSLQIAAMLHNDPAKAYETLKPIVDRLASVAGEVVPADLQQKIDEGKLDLESAREIAKLRAQSSYAGSRAKLTEAEQRTNAFTNAMDSWVGDKQKADPDYKPKTSTDPDGLFEMTEAKFAMLVSNAPPKTPADAIALAEKAYVEAKRTFTSRVLPQKKPMKVLRSSRGSSNGASAEPQTMADAIAKAAGR